MAELMPTQRWQALVPELPPHRKQVLDEPDRPAPADTAERLLLLLHYAIDWEKSWVADSRKTYWDKQLPGRVRHAAYRHDSLDGWWSEASVRLGAASPRQQDRRLELAILLGEPPIPVITEFREHLPALILRVRIIAEAVAAQRQVVNLDIERGEPRAAQ
ncbi:hypothetical protein [Mycobacterium sp. DBP42]|uniref:hypothetical protein n=1 Tax=Mycobacteriaceae TaxID=1762 RepID=UPI00110CC3D4|nr:hypothetical protein [Mycobacterium sp. DBP42]TMS50667.1 hypothetical protein E0T84_22505 [Mycobacterium sp. DBP42]